MTVAWFVRKHSEVKRKSLPGPASYHCHAAVADATLGENTIGEVLHVSA
jgi:hypothetical protein